MPKGGNMEMSEMIIIIEGYGYLMIAFTMLFLFDFWFGGKDE